MSSEGHGDNHAEGGQQSTVQPKKRRQYHPVLEFGMAALATSMACVLSNPMEVVKTRMQLQGELIMKGSIAGDSGYRPPYRNFAHAFYKICRDEGLRGIQAGLLPGLLYQSLMNGTRLSLFAPISAAFGADAEKNGRTSFFFRSLAAGAVCGACGAFVGSPLFLVKARLQSQSTAHNLRTPGAGQFQYRGMWHAFTDVIRREGLLGMTRGMNASIARVMVGSAAQLSSYSSCKAAVLRTGLFEDNIYTYLASSMVAGLVVTTAMNPLDVISTRLYTQGGGVSERYRGILDCGLKTIRVEGLPGLFKGWTAHYFRLGPHTIFTFLFWEEIKKLADRLGL